MFKFLNFLNLIFLIFLFIISLGYYQDLELNLNLLKNKQDKLIENLKKLDKELDLTIAKFVYLKDLQETIKE